MIDFFRSQIYELALCDFVKFCIIILNLGAEKVSSATHNNKEWGGGADVIISSMTELVDWRTMN